MTVDPRALISGDPYENDPNPPSCPKIRRELVAYLESLYPDKCPTLGLAERQIWWRVGAASVVRHLRECLEKQSPS